MVALHCLFFILSVWLYCKFQLLQYYISFNNEGPPGGCLTIYYD